MLISVTPGSEGEVISKLLKIPQIKEAAVVYGEYDIIAKIETKDLKELDDIVTKIRQESKDILKTTTMISV